MKGTKQYFPVVLFMMLYKLGVTFESVGETLRRSDVQNTNNIITTFDSITNKLPNN